MSAVAVAVATPLLSANAASHWPQGGGRVLADAMGLPACLPAAVAAALWRADQLGTPVAATLPSGFAALDAELPGGGWPCHSLSEILSAQSGILEWRLLGPLLRRQSAAGRAVVLVGPPKPPHPPGLRHEGLDEKHLVWVQAHTPGERLWATEQLIRSQACGVLIAWLPQVRPEQIRRLQVLAAQNPAPVLVCRPSSAAHESSAAPLRLRAQVGPDWSLRVEIVKRKGPPLDHALDLASVPGGLSAILTPRLRLPSRLLPVRDTTPLLPREVPAHVVVSPVAAGQPQHH